MDGKLGLAQNSITGEEDKPPSFTPRNATSPQCRRGLGIGFIFRCDVLQLQNRHL